MKSSRLEALADGIFAIAMTLLVLDLHIPATSTNLRADMIALAPRLFSLIISFIILGIYWIGHHYLLVRLKDIDITFVWRNIIFLLPISLVPFVTALLGTYPLSHTAQIVYGGDLALCGSQLFFCMHFILHNRELYDGVFSMEFKRNAVTKIMLPVAMYVLAMGVTFISPWLGLVFLGFGPLISFISIDSRTWSFLVKPTDWAYSQFVAKR